MSAKQIAETPEKALAAIYRKASAEDKFAFFSGALVCLLVNMFVYTNTCFVHDSIMLFNDSTGVQNGRLLVGPLFAILNRMQIPWVIGMLTCILMGFVTVYLARIFKIKSKLNTVILAGIVITSDAIVVSHTYFGSVYMYAFSLLMAVMAVYYADRKKCGIVISVVLLTLSILTYQAYLATAVCLFVYKLIIDLKSEKKNSERIIQIAKYAAIAIASAALFYVIWQIVLKLSAGNIVESYAYDEMGVGSSISDFSGRVVQAFRLTFIKLFPFYEMSQAYPLKYIISALTIVSFIAFAFLQNTVSKILYFFIYQLTFIFAVNLTYFLSGIVSHELTTFSYIFPMLGLLFLIENRTEFPKLKLQKQLTWCTCILCVILIAGQSVYANSLYLKMKVNYDNAWSYATRIVDRLEQTEGFNKDTRVVIAGYNPETAGSNFKVTEYERNKNIQHAVNYNIAYRDYNNLYSFNNAITYPKTLEWFITQEMDMAIDIEGNAEEFRHDKRIDEMPVFPSEGSVQWLDGTLIVKIS